VQGLELSRRFYFEAVRPILEREFPNVDHAAALIGHGSEVLGFDDERSRDHQWGPRVQLFVTELRSADRITEAMANRLPLRVAGFPTNFGPTDEEGTVALADVDAGPINHRVETIVLSEYLRAELGVDPKHPRWLGRLPPTTGRHANTHSWRRMRPLGGGTTNST
jgi:hypothetical protein